MHITAIMVVTFITCCFRIGTVPWKYFQVNARYFSKELGIFSKLAMDQLIPERWRLSQQPDDAAIVPDRYPVFLKPEWGQNAQGILRADNLAELQDLRGQVHRDDKEQKYILQECAPGAREFEIFSIDNDTADGHHDVLTVTEAVNKTERFPINSKYNRNTSYCDITCGFSATELRTLSEYLEQVGQFGIARMSVRADSTEALLAGDFHVIEINLFLPMPINLLDSSYSWPLRLKFIGRSMMSLAHTTKAIKPVEQPPAIFTRMMLYGRKKTFPPLFAKIDARRTIL